MFGNSLSEIRTGLMNAGMLTRQSYTHITSTTIIIGVVTVQYMEIKCLNSCKKICKQCSQHQVAGDTVIINHCKILIIICEIISK